MQPSSSAQALQQLQQQQSTAQNPNDILAGQEQQLGVNSAKDTVTGLRGAINNTTNLLQKVAPSVMGRTAQSLVTNAQATRQIQNEQAPLNQNLSTETGQYNDANTNLNDLESKATQASQGIYQGQQDKLSYLQNLYNTLYKQEQDASSAAEQKRAFDAQQAAATASKASASGGGGGSSSGGGSTAAAPHAQQRADKGFNFQSSGGQAISAATYAALSGISLNSLLQQMANAGDAGAKDVLKNGTKSKYYSAIAWS